MILIWIKMYSLLGYYTLDSDKINLSPANDKLNLCTISFIHKTERDPKLYPVVVVSLGLRDHTNNFRQFL